MPVYTLPQPDPRLAEPLHGFWNLPGVKWLLPSTPQDQAGSMGQPMGMAEPLAARAVGLAIALPEYLHRQFGKVAPLMQDWSQALPGLYRGYRAGLPGSIGKAYAGKSEPSYDPIGYAKGTFIARDLPYAQQYAANIPSGGGGPVVHDVLAEVQQPLSLEVPEHRQLLARAMAEAEKESYVSRGNWPPAPGYHSSLASFRSLAERMLNRLHNEGYTVRVPEAVSDEMRARGFDALLMPRELEGQYPTMIHFRPEGIRMTPRSHEEGLPGFAAVAAKEGGYAGLKAYEKSRVGQAEESGIVDWAMRLTPQDRLRVGSQLRRLMSTPGYYSDPNQARMGSLILQNWTRKGDREALNELIGEQDVDALPLLSRIQRWESRAPTGARPMSAIETILNHPARHIYETGSAEGLLTDRETASLMDYLRLVRDETYRRGYHHYADAARESMNALRSGRRPHPIALSQLLQGVPEELASEFRPESW